MSNPSIVIASAGRTAVGAFNGAFATVLAHELGAAVVKGALERAWRRSRRGGRGDPRPGALRRRGPEPGPPGGDEGRSIPKEATAWGVNQLCGSGLRAVALGMQQIATGDAKIIVAYGGQESMSMAPHAAHLRGGVKMGDMKMIDTMIKDGLTDAFHGYHMGITAENVARQWQLSRDDQDQFAVSSQNKAEAAQKA